MLDLRLREEFRGKRLKGTTVDFTNTSKTGALDVSAVEFLNITYPSFDLLKTIEATSSSHSRPVVLLGARGQGKSHLLAALYHLFTNSQVGHKWLTDWAEQLKRPEIASLSLRTDCCVIAESLHLQRYKFLWDIIFERHPDGKFFEGKWQGLGDKKTDVPSDLILVEMFQQKPAVVILDEFQTWFEGLTNTGRLRQNGQFGMIVSMRFRRLLRGSKGREDRASLDPCRVEAQVCSDRGPFRGTDRPTTS